MLEELEEAVDHVRHPLAQREQELMWKKQLVCGSGESEAPELCGTRVQCVYHMWRTHHVRDPRAEREQEPCPTLSFSVNIWTPTVPDTCISERVPRVNSFCTIL